MNGKLEAEARDALLQLLENRFASHRDRHPNIEWAEVRSRLEVRPEALWTIAEMERTGGVPDVVELPHHRGLAQDVQWQHGQVEGDVLGAEDPHREVAGAFAVQAQAAAARFGGNAGQRAPRFGRAHHYSV